MNRGLAILGVIVLIGGIIAYTSLFVVTQVQQALVLQFGEPIRSIQDPGLKFKLPWQNVIFYEKRVLALDPPKQQVILSDQKRLDVDSYARFKIVDPLLFYQTVTDEAGARSRLSPLINSALRRALGNDTLFSVLSDKRVGIMADIRSQANAAASTLGIELIEVRIRRADYPEATTESIYTQMRTEREEEAQQLRGEGQEQAEKIRADADKRRVVILADARKQSEILRGQGDADAIRIYAEAFGQDPEFFAFYRSMQAYRNAMGSGDTTMVLSPDSDFFKFFKDIQGAPSPQ